MTHYIKEKKQNEIDNFITWLTNKTILGLDTETTGLDPFVSEVILLQIGDENTQWVFNTKALGKDFIKHILSIVVAKNIKLILHNAKFDYKFIKHHFDIDLNNIFCTMLAAQILSGGDKNIKLSLKSTLKRFLNASISKDERESFIDYNNLNFDKSQIDYAATDVMHLPNLYRKMNMVINKKSEKYNLPKLPELVDLEMQCVKVTANLELNGIYINKEKWLNLKKDAEEKKSQILNELNEILKQELSTNLFGEVEINFDSNIQVKKMLETLLKTEIPTTSVNFLKSIKEKHKCIPLIIEYRKWTKLISTYGEEFVKKHVHTVTNRIHSSFNQLGTETGRYSSDSPNLQNIPALQEYRDPFCAQKENYKIISADFSSQELLILTHITKEDTFIKAIKENKDLHAFSASILFDIDYSKFFKYKEDGSLDTSEDENGFDPNMKKNYRNKAKSITFGMMYGIGPKKLSEQLSIPYEEAKELIDKYFEKFPKIKTFMQEMETLAEENNIAISPLDGRFRSLKMVDFDDVLKRAHALNQAKNMPIQSCGASMTKRAMLNIQKIIEEQNLDAKLILTVHDEILVECHESIADKMKEVVKNCMIESFNYYIPDLTMKINPKVDTKWVH